MVSLSERQNNNEKKQNLNGSHSEDKFTFSPEIKKKFAKTLSVKKKERRGTMVKCQKKTYGQS